MRDFLLQATITAASVVAVAVIAATFQNRQSVAGMAIMGATRSCPSVIAGGAPK